MLSRPRTHVARTLHSALAGDAICIAQRLGHLPFAIHKPWATIISLSRPECAHHPRLKSFRTETAVYLARESFIAHKLQRERRLSGCSYLIARCAISATGFTIVRYGCRQQPIWEQVGVFATFLKTKAFQRLWSLLRGGMIPEGFSEPSYTTITIQGFFSSRKPTAPPS